MQYVHPAPDLSIRNQTVLKFSTSLCQLCFCFSVIGSAEIPLYITFATFALCMAHNITLLVLTFREQKGKRILRAGMLPATITRAAWISAIFLAVCWCATIAVLLVSCAGLLDDGKKRRSYQKVMPWLEWIFASFEVATLGAFVVGSIKERRAVLAVAGSPAPGRWDVLSSATSLQSA